MSSDVKIWIVIKFSDNSVEAVPTGWIVGNLCYCPTFSKEKLNTAIRKSENHSTHAGHYFILKYSKMPHSMIICMSARHKARKAEDTSDLNSNSASEGFEARRMRTGKHHSPSSSDSRSDDETIPLPPKIQNTISKTVDQAKSSKIIEVESTPSMSRAPVNKTQTSGILVERNRGTWYPFIYCLELWFIIYWSLLWFIIHD